jgi:hypothetical protein
MIEYFSKFMAPITFWSMDCGVKINMPIYQGGWVNSIGGLISFPTSPNPSKVHYLRQYIKIPKRKKFQSIMEHFSKFITPIKFLSKHISGFGVPPK